MFSIVSVSETASTTNPIESSQTGTSEISTVQTAFSAATPTGFSTNAGSKHSSDIPMPNIAWIIGPIFGTIGGFFFFLTAASCFWQWKKRYAAHVSHKKPEKLHSKVELQSNLSIPLAELQPEGLYELDGSIVSGCVVECLPMRCLPKDRPGNEL